VDLGAVQARLGSLEEAVRGIRMPSIPPQIDLARTEQRLDALERAVRAIVIPPAQSVDLGPVMQKLSLLEARAARPTPAVVRTSAPAQSSPVVRAGSRNLLARAAFGKPDDLKLIKGVAGVLEKMLHRIGVYYFWQIAEWTAADVAHADAQLTAFKGRIKRDDWVVQSRALARSESAARKPATI
jgi:predicted flap endonuclease-1-like 5' DNA nuclease